jgi:hypothetical protein
VKDLAPSLGSFMYNEQSLPAKLAVSNPVKYFWWLQCGKHLCMMTIQCAKNRHAKAAAQCASPAGCKHVHVGRCLRCDVPGYRLCGPAPNADEKFASYYAQMAWLHLEYALDRDGTRNGMSASQHYHDVHGMVGRDLGLVLEARVLQGNTYGAADIFVPRCNLIIQVDGQHHDDPQQIQKDHRFNEACKLQLCNLLRLHWKDVGCFGQYIRDAVDQCLGSSANVVFVLATPSSHPMSSDVTLM